MKSFYISIFLLVNILPNLSWGNTKKNCDKSRLVLNDRHGFISDGLPIHNYTHKTHCEWLINGTASGFVTLKFNRMDTECGYDFVFVYDGSSMSDKLIGSFSGKNVPPLITSTSNYMLIVFFSDTNYVLSGFEAEYKLSDCPQDCSNHGTCLEHNCQCDPGWTGPLCSRETCPDDCGNPTGKGFCDEKSSKCMCNPGFSGIDCSLDEQNYIGNTWHYLAKSDDIFIAKTGHTSVYSAKHDRLFTYGGYDLNSVLDTFTTYNFNSSTWSQVQISSLPKPPGLYGHAMTILPDQDNFVIFGGFESVNGKTSHDLWLFNIPNQTWHLKASDSLIKPPGLSKHTLTLAENYLYLFGGSLPDGTFSNQMFRINAKNLTEWEKVAAKGGQIEDLHVTGHSMVYYSEIKALILFGGLRRDVPRFSQLSGLMYQFNVDSLTWNQMKLASRPANPTSKNHIPPERAFHSAQLMGNYMVIFGGYSHKHNEVENCYDNRLFFYHLGCQTWVSRRILEHSPQGKAYPKTSGLFGHASSIKGQNILIISGGFHGTVSGDVLAYTLPKGLSVKRNDRVCGHYGSQISCSSNPECGWCPTDGICYLRTDTSNCASNLKTVQCPGLCPGLTDCQSCVLHGSRYDDRPAVSKIIEDLSLDACAWCSHLQECQPRHANPDLCGTKSVSRFWWNTNKKIAKIAKCQSNDFRPGITLVKYYSPPNMAYPDEVTISNVSQALFRPVNPQGTLEMSDKSDQFIVRMMGAVHAPDTNYVETRPDKLEVCADFASMNLKLSKADGPLNLVKNVTFQYPQNQEKILLPSSYHLCQTPLNWPGEDNPIYLLPGNELIISK